MYLLSIVKENLKQSVFYRFEDFSYVRNNERGSDGAQSTLSHKNVLKNFALLQLLYIAKKVYSVYMHLKIGGRRSISKTVNHQISQKNCKTVSNFG